MEMPQQIKGFVASSSLAEMKANRFAPERVYSFGAKADLREHFTMLKLEFGGKTELEFYHALLIVLIRREIDLSESVVRFKNLWAAETNFLVKNLDSRWLVSACDTITDYWPSSEERALAASASLFANTCKLYETERWATGQSRGRKAYRPIEGRVPLHDGMSAFTIGDGNMLFNLHRRVRGVCKTESVAGSIFIELLRRASECDTVYGRFRQVHNNDATRWW
jgi:hypothetical protein